MLLLLYFYSVDDVFKEINAFAQHLPLVKENTKFGKKAYEVGKKSFFIFDEGKSAVLVRITPKKEAQYQTKSGFFISEIKDDISAWVGIDLTIRKDLNLLKELVIDSFHFVANKKARNKLYSQFPI